MKVIVDNKIPYIKEAIDKVVDEVVYAPGREFSPQLIRDADALIVRTRTCCNEQLLRGSRVKFIATATIGFDHIDTVYCRTAGITWTNAPGCNAASVAQYIQSSLLLLQKTKGMSLNQMTIGVVGVGNVGSKVVAVAQKLGMRVLLNDLPRKDMEGKAAFTSLQEMAAHCDVISFHTPLYKEGNYKTYHLADGAFFESLQRHPVIINTSRGEVIDTTALIDAIDTRQVSTAIIDVWEHEPDINHELLSKVMVGTPHIAGYSADGKANATRISLDALCRHFGIQADYEITPPWPKHSTITAKSYEEAVLSIYNPNRDSTQLKAHPELFEMLREEYPLRREEGAYNLHCNGAK